MKNKMEKRVSICIPTCDRPEHVDQALRSVLDQQPAPYEILIGDDSSDKETARLIRRYTEEGAPIQYIWNEPSLGQRKNVDRLFRKAEGDFIVLLHDDDRLLDGALNTLLSCFQNHLNIVSAFGKQQLASDEGAVNWRATENLNEDFHRTEEYAGVQSSPLRSAIIQQFPNDGYMVRADAAEQVGYSHPGTGDACDFVFGVELARQMDGDFYYVDTYTSQYRRSKDSIVRGGDRADAAYKALKLVLKDFPENVLEDPLVDKWIRMRMPVAIMDAALHGHTKDGWDWFFSTYHSHQITTLGGLRRFFHLVRSHFKS